MIIPHQTPPPPPSFFCRLADTSTTRANLPHWEQRGVTCFVTFRLADSLPKGKLDALGVARDEWLAQHPAPWDDATAAEYRNEFDGRVQAWLDAGHGRCILKEDPARQIVERVLRRFDRVRYVLHAFVVMPNHAHVLFTPLGNNAVSAILRQWKGVSAHEINALRGTHGTIWQKESWDTLVRSQQHFDNVLRYMRGTDTTKAWSVYG